MIQMTKHFTRIAVILATFGTSAGVASAYSVADVAHNWNCVAQSFDHTLFGKFTYSISDDGKGLIDGTVDINDEEMSLSMDYQADTLLNVGENNFLEITTDVRILNAELDALPATEPVKDVLRNNILSQPAAPSRIRFVDNNALVYGDSKTLTACVRGN